MRRKTSLLLATSFAAVAALTPAAAPAEDLKPETVSVARLDPAMARLYAADIAINHIADGRLHVLNAATLDYAGLIGTGFAGMVYVPKARDVVYVATTYYPKLTRGDRSDFLEVYDTATLELKKEIKIPSRRAQALNYRPLMQGSVDGRFVLIQNVTPATSITVVDVKSGKVTGEVANPGCYGIYPSATAGARFATLCGDGTVRGYTLDKAGRKAEIKASAKVFDADKDALFVHAEPDGTSLLFVSFKGDIYRISVDGDVPTLVETIPMTAGTEGDWRPGGYQPIAFDAKTGILYALMHKGGTEGSHKNPAEEIWAFDVKSKKILARSPSQLATSLTILPGDAPALFAVNPIDVSIIRYEIEPGGGVKEGKVSKVGEAVVQLEAK